MTRPPAGHPLTPVPRPSTAARVLAALSVVALLGGLGPAASASVPHPDVVSEVADDRPPVLAATTAVPRPRVDALTEVAGSVVAGGWFGAVADGGEPVPRANLMAFDAATGDLRSRFAPSIGGGTVRALAVDEATGSVYVGGSFRTVDGVARAALAKVDAVTGALDRRFAPVFTAGQVNDLELVSRGGVTHLVVAGTPSRKLMSLDPATGLDDRWLRFSVTDKLEGSWGGVAPYQLALDPSGTRLAVTGNFSRIGGVERSRFALIDLAPGSTSLSDWYYPGFAKPCSSTAPRRIAYLQGVDFSPDGRHLTVAATGQVPLHPEDVWYARLGTANRLDTTVCDGVGRFALDDDARPEWISYTGGDSVWTVADTGAAVYAAGHFKYVDNPDGYASIGVGDKTSGAPASPRPGVAALDPASGLALPWNPRLGQTRIGGKALLADAGGLWLGNDATSFNGAARLGLQRAPLAVAAPPVPDAVVWAVGQACGGGDVSGCAQVGRLIASDPETSAVLGLGDLQGPSGTLAEYEGTFDTAMGAGVGLKDRFLPVPGALDYRTEGAAGYHAYWGERAGEPGLGYYARTLGAWRLVAANSHCSRVGGCGGNQLQGRFLAAEVGAPSTTCELVLAHHSAFSDGVRGDHAWGRSVFDVAARNGAELILSGHDTGYQRFAARRADGSAAPEDGLTPLVVGTGGAPARGWAPGAARSEYRQDAALGAVRLVLSEQGWSARFIAVDGRVLDRSSGSCHT